MIGFYCLRCGAPIGGCKCWEQVTLECPQCERTKLVERDPSDPPAAIRVVVSCDRCALDGNKGEVIDYFDAAGKQVFLP